MLRPSADRDKAMLKALVASRLSSHKVPGQITFRDSLPMTPTHRVARDGGARS